MEKGTVETAMKRSISEVLEKMFFMPVDFPSTSKQEWAGLSRQRKYMMSKLEFSGPFSGYFLFFIPEEITSSLAAGFLGQDEDHVTMEHRADTVKEIINMIAGNAFSILDDHAIFDLDIPQMMDCSDLEGALSKNDGGLFIPVQTVDSYIGVQLVMH